MSGLSLYTKVPAPKSRSAAVACGSRSVDRPAASRPVGDGHARGGVRLRFVRAVRHVLASLLPPERLPVHQPVPPPVAVRLAPPTAVPPPYLPPAHEEALHRARAALAEARAEMPTLLQDSGRPERLEEVEYRPAEAVGLRQALRAYTDHVDRLLAAADEERRALRAQVMRLSEELLLLQAEVADLRARLATPATPAELPTPPAALPEPEPAPPPSVPAETIAPPAETPRPEPAASAMTPALSELESRVFPAGTIGVLVALSPVDDFYRLTMIQERLALEPLVEHVELSSYEFGEARIRLTFRQPVRWPWIRAAIEAAAGAPVAPEGVTPGQGIIHVRLATPPRTVGGPAARR